MLRFAPSPTGDLHIGNLRVALYNYILSVQRDEPLLIRMDDSTKEHNIPGKDKEILDLLDLFGIKYHEQQFQSNHLKFHRAMALQLLQDKKAFNCFCTPETLDQQREAAINAKLTYRYDGTCEYLFPEEVIDNPAPFTIRLKKPSHSIRIKDIFEGELTFESEDIDSFILMSADKHPTYNFACAVDDMLADVSLIIREAKHLNDTPKQIAIHMALGYDRKVEYAHLPGITGDDTITIKSLLEDGYLPEAITNYLISMGNKTPNEIFTLKEAVKWFDLSSISKDPVHFEIEKLQFFNREYLKGLDPKELSRYVGFADEEIGKLAKLYLTEVSTLKELRTKISAIFTPKEMNDEYNEIRDLTLKAPHFDDYESYQNYLIQNSGFNETSLAKPLRMLLSGAEHGPQMSDLYAHIKNYIKEVVK